LPSSALAEVHSRLLETGADVVLGVFPVDEPERLGPVEIGPDGSVIRVLDKPGSTPHRNTWGVASWTARFTSFCGDWAAAQRKEHPDGELALGHAFEAARKEGLSVRAVFFEGGQFLDVGTPRGLRAALGALATQGVLVANQAATARDPRRP
jgi:glucose-1-phosphate thymidylyltransferase